MAKNLDGIKKLNPDEVKKYRKIVLDYIGEKDTAATEEKNKLTLAPATNKVVDGINFSRIKNKNEDKKNSFDDAIKRQEDERRRIQGEEKQYLLKKEREVKNRLLKEQEKIKQEKSIQEEKEKKLNELKEKRLQEKEELVKQEKIRQLEKARQAKELIERERKDREEKIKQEEIKKKEVADLAKREAKEKRLLEEKKIWREKIELEEREKEEKRRVEENYRRERIKRQAELEKIKLERQKASQIAGEKKKAKRLKAIRKFRKNLNQKFREIFYAIKKNIVYAVLLLIVFIALAYIIFCLAVLRFNQYNFIKKAADFFPVPAVITTEGLINYNDFQNVKNSGYSSLSPNEKKNNLVKWAVINNFKKRYGSDDSLAIMFVSDKNFNQVGLSRIKKIKELLDAGNSVEQLSKYADEYSDRSYFDEKSITEKFGTEILNFPIGRVSDIIVKPNGYYIIKRIEDKNGQFGVKYIFVGALTLDQYINDKLKDSKIFILAN